MMKNKTRDMTDIAVCAVMMAVCSWISIPAAVPFTLQTFGVFLSVGLLGGKKGTMAVLVHILMGAVGLPVWAGFTGGAGVLFGSTGGYILGFLGSALVMWGMEALLGKKTWVTAVSMILGLLVCYAFGTVWFMEVYAQNTEAIGLGMALSWCVLPFVVPDLVKIAIALSVSKRLAVVMRLEA